jgi:acetyl esterase/lipase
MALLSLGVAAPEVSPLLLLVSLVLAALALSVSGTIAHRSAAVLAIAASVLYALPLVQALAAIPRFDAAFAVAGIGVDDTTGHAPMRRRPLAINGLFPGFDSDAVVTRGIPVAAPGGIALHLDVYQPRDGKAGRPILVQIYGGAWQRGTPADDAAFARYFAAHGYVVFAIDYRHAPQWQWPAQIDDVQTALGWIRLHAAAYQGDPARLALIGRSSGGQLALAAAYSDRASPIAAVVSYYGPTDLTEGWRRPPRPDPLPVRPTLEAYLGGTPETVAARYRDASPVNHVSTRVPPTLLIYGRRDHIVESRFARELAERLKAAGARPVMLEIPWAEHAFDVIPFGLSAQVSLYYTERFLASALR